MGALGAPGWSNPLGLPPATSYVVFLVDGLGWNLLQDFPQTAPYLWALAQQTDPITCGVPSTTATSLTSLGTGLPPGQHGIVGFTSRIPGTDKLLDALRWDADVDPIEWQPHETVFGRARAGGVNAIVVSRRVFEGSGLTVASQRGAEYIGADTPGERISAAVRAASQPSTLVYMYEGELDATGHRVGCRSWAWEHQLGVVDEFAQRLRAALPPEVALVVTADHGMVDVAPDRRIDVDAEVELLEGINLLGGEARLRHLYCEAGAVGDVVGRWRNRLEHQAIVLTRDEAIAGGWFGDVDGLVRPRLGDVVVASVGDIAVMSSQRFPHEAKLVGLHGSLTSDEMLIPLLVDGVR
jgi:predicted AlkP superfamily pyrophosphatase or phosphodiesterase